MHRIWQLLFPLWVWMWTFAEGNGDGGDDGGGDDDGADDDGADDDGGDDDGSEDSQEELEEFDAEAAKAELAKVRKALKAANSEARERRLKLKKFEDEEAERQKEAMGDLERAQAELVEATEERDRLRVERTDLAIRHAVELGAMKLGFVDPADAFSLVDLGEIEVDEESFEVAGVEKALKTLAKAKPYLLEEESGEKGHGTPTLRKKGGGGKRKGVKEAELPERSMVSL